MKPTLLKIPFEFGGIEDSIYSVVIEDEASGARILVDAAYTGFLEKLETALREAGVAPESITHLLITHQDHDHMGAAADFKEKYPQVTIVAGADEADYIDGSQKNLRLAQAEAFQAHLPEAQKSFGEAFIAVLKAVKPVQVDRRVTEGETLFGWTVLETPGHTPGHISLYDAKMHAVITGDAFALESGVPVIANPQFTLNLEMAEKSMARLVALEAETYYCYHGGIWSAQ
jgi:glyoxylase-like metal-dependent hydrolase (beta-lactamase superfamily II)